MVVIQTLLTGSILFVGEILHVVEFGEFPAVIRRGVLLKFFLRLPSKVAAINEKQYPVGFCKLDEPIGETHGGVRFPAAGCHLD